MQAVVNASLTAHRRERRTLLRTDDLKAWRRAVAGWRKKYARRPKWGHRDIAARDADVPRGVEILKDPHTGELTSDPERLLQIQREQRLKTAAPPPAGKGGVFSATPPQQGERSYPWEAPDALDNFSLCTRVDPAGQREDLLPKMKDFSRFERILRQATKQKQPGPDGVPNELLQVLPVQMHRGMHSMFVTMWLTGETPALWKHSHTVMLYKKSDPTDPNNYRPIGLALTIYKLWTAMLTAVLSDYASENAILNDSQYGFTARRSTHLQLMNVLNALEDAKMYRRDIYMLYVDVSAAFDTVDHDKLLQLMWDMGFPLHAVQAVQGLYNGASTSIRAAFGTSDPVEIERGALQGDSLSPFLFLLFIEPLLRWLHVGGRGYKHGCTPTDEREKWACSAPAFADDLAAFAGTAMDLRRQADKITTFLEWSGMEVNHKKCGATGMLYGSTASGRVTGDPLSKNAKQVLGRELSGLVRVSGQAVPYLDPDQQPYRYLGEAYVAELTAKLTDSLNDRGRLGHVTWLLLEEQIRRE
ncbi:hypothetical protein ABPG77_007952 [Micractinium sp. CCAP 211/92]